MPQTTRNFWIRLDVDGRTTTVETGPRAADGGFSLTVLMREDGTIAEKRLRVRGYALSDGTLLLEATTEGSDSDGRIALRTPR